MPETIPLTGQRSYQIPPRSLAVTSDEALEIRRLYLGVVGALRPRPQSRGFWDDCAREDAGECLARNAWVEKTVLRIREALVEAETQGALPNTVDRVRVFFDALAALTLRGFETFATPGLDTALVAATEDAAEMTVAASHLQHEHTEGNLEAVRFAAMEAIREEERVLELASRELAATRTTQARRRELALR